VVVAGVAVDMVVTVAEATVIPMTMGTVREVVEVIAGKGSLD
jgi:hypothetical protein